MMTEQRRADMNSYLLILQESLQKKVDILGKIMDYEVEQLDLLKQDSPDLEAFDRAMDEKTALADEITALDEGFETLYERVRKELSDNKEYFADSIREMQDLIARITEQTANIQAAETRIRMGLESYARKEAEAFRKQRSTGRAALSYHEAMHGTSVVDSQFYDRKQ